MEMTNKIIKPWAKYLRRVVLALLICLLSALLLFFSLPWLLIRPAETAPADVVLYFASGNTSDTERYVAELYQQGLAKKIVCLSRQITWQIFPADFAREHLLQRGLPAEAVTTFHLPRADCDAELGGLLRDFLQQQGWKRVLVVTTPIASRALNRTLSPSFTRAQISLSVTYAPADAEALRGQWWREHRKTQQVVQQGIETALDLFYPHCG